MDTTTEIISHRRSVLKVPRKTLVRIAQLGYWANRVSASFQLLSDAATLDFFCELNNRRYNAACKLMGLTGSEMTPGVMRLIYNELHYEIQYRGLVARAVRKINRMRSA